ncbi:hypothetical protein LXL04_004553 [Taraxacum kok-saghyz]
MAPVEDVVMENVLADGLGSLHYNRTFKAELTVKAVIGTIINECFPRFTSTQQQLFASGPFGQFLDMLIPNGDPLLIHAMMLHEECDQGVAKGGGFDSMCRGYMLSTANPNFVCCNI